MTWREGRLARVSDDDPSRAARATIGGRMPVNRVRKAHEQVSDQLRELIVAGELAPAQRLPSEAVLASDFGVSRATVREALRSLAAQNMIRSAKGAGGGTFVSRPSVDHVSEFLSASMALLSQSADVSLDEFLEARELLEVPAARLAARRGSETALAQLGHTIPEHPRELAVEQQFMHNRDFHFALVEASGNTLLRIAAQPVFSVLQTNLKRSQLGRKFHDTINHDHQRILDAVMAGDEDAAAEEMVAHLHFLRPMYERVWRAKRPD